MSSRLSFISFPMGVQLLWHRMLKKAIFLPLNCFSTFVKNQLRVFALICFRVLYVPSIHVCHTVLISVAICSLSTDFLRPLQHITANSVTDSNRNVFSYISEILAQTGPFPLEALGKNSSLLLVATLQLWLPRTVAALLQSLTQSPHYLLLWICLPCPYQKSPCLSLMRIHVIVIRAT